MAKRISRKVPNYQINYRTRNSNGTVELPFKCYEWGEKVYKTSYCSELKTRGKYNLTKEEDEDIYFMTQLTELIMKQIEMQAI